MNHYCICQSVTNNTFDANSKVQEITRDLQKCDFVIIERDILKSYNTSLLTENYSLKSLNTDLARDKEKYKKRAKNRLIIIGSTVLTIAAKILITKKL
tara:strand:+ start:1193 stop:1486 length:294 start_codon:yes stop_codon:yes gene_type:complete